MRRLWWVALAAGAAIAVWLSSCVSSDDSMGIPAGQDGGPCLVNNTCDQGLVCQLENGTGVCVPSSDGGVGMDSSVDVGSHDASGDASDAADSTCMTPTIDFVADCLDANTIANYAMDAATVGCSFSTLGTTFNVGCDNLYNSGFYCCVDGTYALVDAGCVTDLTVTPLAQIALHNGGCPNGPHSIVCTSNVQCVAAEEAGMPVSKCMPVVIEGPPLLDGVVTGICQ
jgi:hypothetical protein